MFKIFLKILIFLNPNQENFLQKFLINTRSDRAESPTFLIIQRNSFLKKFDFKVIDCNGSQLKNSDISGAICTLSFSILILNSRFVEGAKYVRVF